MQNVVVVVGGGVVVVVVGGGFVVVVVVGGFVVVVVGGGFVVVVGGGFVVVVGGGFVVVVDGVVVVVVAKGGFVLVVVDDGLVVVVDDGLVVVVDDGLVVVVDDGLVDADAADVVRRVVVVPEITGVANEEEEVVVVGTPCELEFELTAAAGWTRIKASPPAAVVPIATAPATSATWDPVATRLPRLLNWLTIGISNNQASGPITQRWRPTEMLRNALTIAGSN
jgi:hypothetical protein